MSKLKLSISDSNKHYNWLMIADMYFAATVILCKELKNSYISPQNTLNNNTQRIGKKCGFTSSNPDYELLMPIVFNMKHAIELYLKSLIMIFEKENKYPQTHNLIELLDKFLSILKEKKLNGNTIKLLNYKIRKIIERYHFGIYAFTRKKDRPDLYNEAERFPEYKNIKCYEIKKLYTKVDRNLINKIESDCISLRNDLRDKVYLVLSSSIK